MDKNIADRKSYIRSKAIMDFVVCRSVIVHGANNLHITKTAFHQKGYLTLCELPKE